MANLENKQNDQPESTANKTNVTHMNKQSTPGQTASSGSGNSPANRGGGGTGTGTATAKSFYDQAKETAGQAYEAVADKAAIKLDEQKSSLTGGLSTVADSVRQVSDNLGSSKTDSGLAEAAAKYTDTAAKKLENVAGYFESRNVRDMARDLEGFARRNPAVFLGAAFGLGLLAARFLKSSPPSYESRGAGREFADAAAADGKFNTTPSGSPNFEAKPL